MTCYSILSYILSDDNILHIMAEADPPGMAELPPSAPELEMVGLVRAGEIRGKKGP